MTGVVYQRIPYGTVRKCRVDDVVQQGSASMLIVFADGEETTPTLILGDRASADGVAKGDRGTITFTAGGVLGGYWKFKKE